MGGDDFITEKDGAEFRAAVVENGHKAVKRLSVETHTSERAVLDALEKAAEEAEPAPAPAAAPAGQIFI